MLPLIKNLLRNLQCWGFLIETFLALMVSCCSQVAFAAFSHCNHSITCPQLSQGAAHKVCPNFDDTQGNFKNKTDFANASCALMTRTVFDNSRKSNSPKHLHWSENPLQCCCICQSFQQCPKIWQTLNKKCVEFNLTRMSSHLSTSWHWTHCPICKHLSSSWLCPKMSKTIFVCRKQFLSVFESRMCPENLFMHSSESKCCMSCHHWACDLLQSQSTKQRHSHVAFGWMPREQRRTRKAWELKHHRVHPNWCLQQKDHFSMTSWFAVSIGWWGQANGLMIGLGQIMWTELKTCSKRTICIAAATHLHTGATWIVRVPESTGVWQGDWEAQDETRQRTSFKREVSEFEADWERWRNEQVCV